MLIKYKGCMINAFEENDEVLFNIYDDFKDISIGCVKKPIVRVVEELKETVDAYKLGLSA